jgi:hypothetical protein
MKVTLAELGADWRKKFGACLLMRPPGVSVCLYSDAVTEVCLTPMGGRICKR